MQEDLIKFYEKTKKRIFEDCQSQAKEATEREIRKDIDLSDEKAKYIFELGYNSGIECGLSKAIDILVDTYFNIARKEE